MENTSGRVERKRTSLGVYTDTREKMLNIGKKSETFDDLINRLIDEAGHGQISKEVETVLNENEE